MTLEQLYQEIAGNYADIKDRLRKEERIEKFVFLFFERYQLSDDGSGFGDREYGGSISCSSYT